MKLTALLPMKEHSERIPNKNMIDFSGAPLYHAIVKTLLKSECIDRIVIDTDSSRIAGDATKHFGKLVEIIPRPTHLCGDFVSMNKIIEHDIKSTSGNFFIQTHSTNPLLKSSTINEAATYFKNHWGNTCDSIFSVTRIQSRLYDMTGRPLNHDINDLRRTQDLYPVFEENSNFYIFSRESFLSAKNQRIGLRPHLFEVNKLEAVDIDERDDFTLAELIYAHIQQVEIRT